MESELSKHRDTREEYQWMDDSLRRAADDECSDHEETTRSMLASTVEREGMTAQELLQSVLLPEEKLVPDVGPLSVTHYSVSPASAPNDPKKYLDAGQDLDMYLTDRRLLLVQAGQSNHLILEKAEQTEGKSYIVGSLRADSYSCLPIPLTNIYGLSMSISCSVSSQSIVRRKGEGGLLVFGILLLVAGIVVGVVSGFRDRNLTIAMAVLVSAGLGLIVAGILRRQVEVFESEQKMQQNKYLRLLTVDPGYMTKASMRITIDAEKHTARFVARWVSELQGRCEGIRDAKVFEKRLVV